MFIASLWPAVTNGVIIAAMIALVVEIPLVSAGTALIAAQVAAGEIVAVSVVGYSLFRFIILKNKYLYDLIKSV
jgi:hypothetical protein